MAQMYIPLSAVPFQTVSVVVNRQNYRITVRQIGLRVAVSVMVDGVSVSECTITRPGEPIIPWTQTVAKTPLYWVDLQGNEHPQYAGIGTRWLLCFDEVAE